MNAAEFAQKWMKNTRGERSASQEHFLDLCMLLAQPTPNSDPDGNEYAFEKGAAKAGGEDGWADVWRRHFFAWEYKGKHKDLKAAYAQLLQYREALENPPLLVVCDLNRFEIHTNYTNTAKVVHEFSLQDFIDAPQKPLRLLRSVMEAPDDLKPKASREELTEKAAGHFAQLALDLRARGHEAHRVAHFINKLVFSMFAEDIGLLPSGLIVRLTSMGGGLVPDSVAVRRGMQELFQTMSEGGGYFGADKVQWFNGGLFDGDDAIELTVEELESIKSAAKLDWSQIEPAVLGTLFERGLDPDKRSQLGAHYTDRRSIERVVFPVVIEPLEREFEQVKKAATDAIGDVPLKGFVMGAAKTARTTAIRKASAHVTAFLERLDGVRVLDPACGSGNFLYVALQALKDLERHVLLWEVTELGTAAMRFPTLGPHNVLGIELSPYAAELARVAIWIGEIQWMIGNGFAYIRDPILRRLDNIECQDALISRSTDGNPTEAEWPYAEFIIGNPPFLGGKLLRSELGDAYVDQLFSVFAGRVARESDLVVYWHEKARALIAHKVTKRAGLLATQAIRGGANRKVLEKVKGSGDIFLAWSDEEWVVEGAAVHVSIVGFDNGSEAIRLLDGEPVDAINSDLTTGLDLTKACVLSENLGVAFMGDTKGGPFDITGAVAAEILAQPNPHGKDSADVVRPWVNGIDMTARPRGMYIIDFGVELTLEDAALYEAPFEYARKHVFPARQTSKTTIGERWWLHERPRVEMRVALAGLPRYLVTPRVSKHRLFVWMAATVLADSATIVFARDDDYFFGVLHSMPHELWALAMGTQLEDRPRYTPTTTFETFPFPVPAGLQREAIAAAAHSLDELRKGWLDPPGAEDEVLRRRTLTALYNERPTWLRQAHEQLDRAVHDAYGWPYPLDSDEVLLRLLDLNGTRSAKP